MPDLLARAVQDLTTRGWTVVRWQSPESATARRALRPDGGTAPVVAWSLFRKRGATIVESLLGACMLSSVQLCAANGWHRGRNDAATSGAPDEFIPGIDVAAPAEACTLEVLSCSGRHQGKDAATVMLELGAAEGPTLWAGPLWTSARVDLEPGDIVLFDTRLLRRWPAFIAGSIFWFTVIPTWMTPEHDYSELGPPDATPEIQSFFGTSSLPARDIEAWLFGRARRHRHQPPSAEATSVEGTAALAVRMRSFTLCRAVEAVVQEVLAPSALREQLQPSCDDWHVADRLLPNVPIGEARTLVSFQCDRPAKIRLVPGSQGLPAPDGGSGTVIEEARIDADLSLVLDGRCWFRVDDDAVTVHRWSSSPVSIRSRADREPHPQTPASAFIYQIRTAGYAFARSAVAAHQVAELRAELDVMLAEDDALCGAATLDAMGQRGALRNLCDHGPAFQRLLVECPFHEVCDELLGEGYVLHSYDGLVMLPGSGRFPWDFHLDLAPLEGVAFSATRTPGINCLFYLDDVTPQNGATWIVPASHHAPLEAPDPQALARIAIQAVGRAGDALVFDARLWHCAGENTTAHPRRLIKMFFCKPWLRTQMDYSRAVRPEVQESLDDRARRLLAAAPPATVAALRRALSRSKPA